MPSLGSILKQTICTNTPAAEPAVAIFDPELALQRCFDSEEMFEEMIQCFYDEVGELFPQMRAALAQGNLTEVGRLGHRMKGTLVYLGAERAKRVALHVEQFCDEDCGDGAAEAEQAIKALEIECLALEIALKNPLESA